MTTQVTVCNGWDIQPHDAARVTRVTEGDTLYLCDDCLTDYRAETPLESSLRIDNLQAETQALIRNLWTKLHETQVGHDPETAKGCTHYDCVAAQSVLLALGRGSTAT